MLNGTIATDVLRSTITPTAIFSEAHRGAHLATLPSEGVLAIHSTDDARVAWVDISLREEAFESLQWEPMEIGLDLTKLVDITDMMAGDSLAHMTIKGTSERLRFQSNGLSLRQTQIVPSYVSQVTLRPEVDHPAEVVLPGDVLGPIITLANKITSHMTLGVDTANDVFYASADGDTDSVQLIVDRNDTIKLQSADVQSVFPIDYLGDIQEVLPDDTPVRISLGDTAPAVFQYPFASGHGVVSFSLKPSV